MSLEIAQNPKTEAADFIQPDVPALVLAPMEGVTDAPMRAFLTELGGFKFCVAEFIRISQDLLPNRCYVEHLPELSESCCATPSGAPVQVQLLGGNAELLAESAKQVWNLGAKAVDLNFGCPAPTVNRHDGGASLLKYPDRVRSIVRAVRSAVPAHIPVSAKIRLGWDDPKAVFENAHAVEEGGASWLTIHARTKVQGYTPPAHWHFIGNVKREIGIPIIANGDIWTREDFLKCQEVTRCSHFMLGRGALADPFLAGQISQELGLRVNLPKLEPLGPEIHDWWPLILRFLTKTEKVAPETRYRLNRVKQWLRFAAMRGSVPWFDSIKALQKVDDLIQWRAAQEGL
jgi:tRNA-dihydrouridine synthase C